MYKVLKYRFIDRVIYYGNNGHKHREDGPAVLHDDGRKEYWFDGVRYTFEEWQDIVKLKAFL